LAINIGTRDFFTQKSLECLLLVTARRAVLGRAQACVRDNRIPAITDQIDRAASISLAPFVSFREIHFRAVFHHCALDWFRAVSDKLRTYALGNWIIIIVDAVCRHTVKAVQNNSKKCVPRARV
jgi:hypothetical protein